MGSQRAAVGALVDRVDVSVGQPVALVEDLGAVFFDAAKTGARGRDPEHAVVGVEERGDGVAPLELELAGDVAEHAVLEPGDRPRLAHQEAALAVFAQGSNQGWLHAVALAKDPELPVLEAGEPEVGTDPQAALAVFVKAVDGVSGQAFGDGVGPADASVLEGVEPGAVGADPKDAAAVLAKGPDAVPRHALGAAPDRERTGREPQQAVIGAQPEASVAVFGKGRHHLLREPELGRRGSCRVRR